MLEIIPLPALKDNYIWLLKNPANGHVAMVDPSEAEPVLDYLQAENLTPDAILITHHHWDHVGGIPGITRHHDIPVFTPKTESVQGSTHPVREGDVLPLTELNLSLKILDVPGHTAGAVAYYSDSFVLSGDTLFTAGCGRLFEGTPTQMLTSMDKFKTLADSTLVYCGHEYTENNLKFASAVEPDNPAISQRLADVRARRENGEACVPAPLALEKDTNPFLRCDRPAVIKAASRHAAKTLTDPVDVFAAIRKWKDNF